MIFANKAKIVNTYVPEKVKIFIENNLLDELKYFKKKYLCEIKIFSENNFIIPEYKIDLFNKSKKPINSIENINSIILLKRNQKNYQKEKITIKQPIKSKYKTKKTKTKTKIRTLWIRRKKNQIKPLLGELRTAI